MKISAPASQPAAEHAPDRSGEGDPSWLPALKPKRESGTATKVEGSTAPDATQAAGRVGGKSR